MRNETVKAYLDRMQTETIDTIWRKVLRTLPTVGHIVT